MTTQQLQKSKTVIFNEADLLYACEVVDCFHNAPGLINRSRLMERAKESGWSLSLVRKLDSMMQEAFENHSAEMVQDGRWTQEKAKEMGNELNK